MTSTVNSDNSTARVSNTNGNESFYKKGKFIKNKYGTSNLNIMDTD